MFVYSLVSNTSNVLNKRNIGPLGHKLIKITDLIRVTVDQFSFFDKSYLFNKKITVDLKLLF